jgi:flagellar biosynthesis GTPase FlhF
MRIFLTIILSVFLATGVYAQTVRSEKPNEQRYIGRQQRQDARQENRQERRDTRQEDRKAKKEDRKEDKQERRDAKKEARKEDRQERRDTRQEDRKAKKEHIKQKIQDKRQEHHEQKHTKGDRKILGNSDSIFPKSKTNRPINSTFKKNNFGVRSAFGHNKELDSHETFGGTNSQFATKRKPVDETTFPPEIRAALAARKRH